MKKIFLFLFCILPILALAQDHLQNLRNKTARQIANSPNGTRADSSWANSRIGTPPRDLAAAIESRSITPFDLSGTNLIATKDTAVSRSRVLLVPKNYSAAALTFKNQDSALVMVNYTTINITASDTIPVGAEIFMEGKGRFQVSSGVTLYIAGRFNASRARRFYGGGVVRFANAAVERVYPEWFGASNDSTTTISDSGPAVQLAVNATPNGGVVSLANDGRTLQSPKGYVINTTVRIPSERAITIEGNGSVIYSSASDTVFLVQNGSQTTVPSYAISPTRDQPRHHIDGIRFKRTASTLASGVAIAAINTTGMTISNCDFYGYRNNIVFNNQSDGWCENNDVFNCRIAGADTGVSYKVTLGGNNSFATNTLRRVTITAFDSVNARNGIGVFASSGSNLYRNVWDQVIVFPRDSVTCFYFNGKAEDLTGNAHIEYIGAAHRNAMKGFHFASSASDLRFKLHVNITGRIYFDEPNLFYSQIPGSFGYTGITTSLDGNQNHGIEMVVDSSKFTPWFGVIKNSRLGMTTPADSGRILFANFNNSGAGKLDIRARRNAPIEIRSITDNVYSAATANSLRGSALPLQPVGLLDIGGTRSLTWTNPGTADDSSTVDVRNTTHLILTSSHSVQRDTLTAFKGGILGHTLTVNFASDSIVVMNLSGASGSGRLFLLDNDNIWAQSGMKSVFKCESESGGVFWREMSRTSEYGKTTDYSSTVDSIDVAQVNYIRFNRSALGNIRNFYNGIDGQMITTLDRNGKSTYLHLGKGVSKGISLIGAASRRDSSGTRHIFVYDGQEDLWREISLSSNTSTGGGGWQDDGTNVRLETTTDNVTIGDNTNVGKLTVDGDANETQLYVKGHSTQTSPYFYIVDNALAGIFSISPDAGVYKARMDNNGLLVLGNLTTPTNLDNGIVLKNNTTSTISSPPANAFSMYSVGGEPAIHDAQGVVSKLTHAWGALYMSNATNTISTSGTAGTWVKVTGFTLESSPAGQGITAVADSFTVTTAGTYEISVNISLVGTAASTDNFKFAVAKNSTANTNYQAAITTADNTTIVNLSFSGYYVGAVNDRYSLLSTNNSDGDDFTIKQASFTIRRVN